MIHNTKQSGFSLVETLVAITILLIVIVGPMTIVSSAARSTSFASEQVTAFFLAQEGAELVEKVRNDLLLEYFADSNPDPNIFTSANPDPWADFTRTSAGGFFQTCYKNVNQNGCAFYIGPTGTLSTPVSCSTLSNCSVYLDNTTADLRSRYIHSTNPPSWLQPTQFTRQIILEQVPGNPNEVKVTSKVTWRSGSVREDQVVNVETRLFNLYETN